MNILDRSFLEIFQFSNNLPAIGVSFWIKVFVNHITGVAVRIVIYTLSFFILNHFLLILKCRFRDGINKISHSVTFQPHNEFHSIFWNHFIIYSSVFPGSSVEGSSGILNHFEELILTYVFRLLKKHVLK